MRPSLIQHPERFRPYGAAFSGDDGLTIAGGLSGTADSRKLLASFWLRNEGGSGTRRIHANDGGWVSIGLNAAHQLSVSVFNAAATASMVFRTAEAFAAGGGFRHFLLACDTDFAAGAKLAKIAVDGVPDTVITDANAAFDIDFTRAKASVGSNWDANLQFITANLAELWVGYGQYADPMTIMRAFRRPDGGPADLGADGSRPTGTAPTIYLSLRPLAADATGFLTNRGTGGNFSATAGAIALGAAGMNR